MSNIKNIIPRNNKGQRHGYWEWYSCGTLWYKGLFNNDKPLGYEENYWDNGELVKKGYHI